VMVCDMWQLLMCYCLWNRSVINPVLSKDSLLNCRFMIKLDVGKPIDHLNHWVGIELKKCSNPSERYKICVTSAATAELLRHSSAQENGPEALIMVCV
jgi:hypothetical protein